MRGGANLVWRGDSKLSLCPNHGLCLGSLSTYMLKNTSWCVWGVGTGRGKRIPPLTSPDTRGLFIRPFSVANTDGHRTMGGTGHTTQNQKSMQAGDTHQTKGARDTPPQGTCKRRRSLQIQRCHDPTGWDEAQASQRKPLLSHDTRRGAWPAPSEQERRAAERRPGAVATPRGHEHGDTSTDTHRRTRFPTQHGPAFKETGVPEGTPAPPEEMSATVDEPGSAVEFLERLASLLLIRLLVTESRVPSRRVTPRWNPAGSSPRLGYDLS